LAFCSSTTAGSFFYSGQPIDLPVITSPYAEKWLNNIASDPGDVFSNLAFGLEKIVGSVAPDRYTELPSLSIVGLGNFSQRSIKELSGGGVQRVTLSVSFAT